MAGTARSWGGAFRLSAWIDSIPAGAGTGASQSFRSIVREERLGCVMVTHDMAQTARLADRALLMEAGRIVRAGTVNEVLNA